MVMKRRNELYDIGSWSKGALTADGGGAEEGLHDGRVHVDAKIFLLNQACVPSLDSLLDPLSKEVINGGVDDVAQPLLWQLVPLLLLWKVLEAFRVSGDELFHLFDAERLILWDCKVFDIISLDHLPDSSDYVL